MIVLGYFFQIYIFKYTWLAWIFPRYERQARFTRSDVLQQSGIFPTVGQEGQPL